MTPDEFKNWRTRLGMTQEAAGNALGATKRAVQMWEAGDRPISLSIERTCKLLEMETIGVPVTSEPTATYHAKVDTVSIMLPHGLNVFDAQMPSRFAEALYEELGEALKKRAEARGDS